MDNSITSKIIPSLPFTLTSVQFNWSVMTNDLQPHGLQAHQASLSITNSGAYSNSVRWVGDTIQPFLPLSLPFPPVLSISQHHSLFLESALRIRLPKYWNCSISRSNEYLELIFLGFTGLISWPSKELSRVFSSTTVQKHQFFGALLSLWSTSHIHTWLLEKP